MSAIVSDEPGAPVGKESENADAGALRAQENTDSSKAIEEGLLEPGASDADASLKHDKWVYVIAVR